MKKMVILLLIVVGLVAATAQADLLNYWAMYEGTGYTTGDSGTGNNAGVLQEGDNPAANPGEGPAWVNDAQRGTVLGFDGATDYVLTDSQAILGDGARTVSAWVNLSVDKSRHTLVEWGDPTVTTGYFRLLVEDNRLRIEVNGGNALALNQNHMLENQWYHVAVAIDDFDNNGQTRTPEAKFYLDGVQVAQVQAADNVFNTVFNGDEWVRLGGGQAHNTATPREPLQGLLDDVRIYNEALTEAQIQLLMKIQAWNPSPVHGAIQQGMINDSQVDVSFSWNTAVDASDDSVPNPNITKHYFYLQKDDPNFVGVTPQVISAGSPTQPTASAGTKVLDFDGTYYWRVDESIDDSGPADANSITGPVWSFKTLASVPIIDVQPAHTGGLAGDPASLSISVTSITVEDYQWYKSIDNANDTSGDDVPVGSNSNTYAVGSASLADEAYYYCVITNVGGVATSDPAFLTIKRMVLNWAFENDFSDSSGEGHDGDVSLGDPNAPTFSTDVPGSVGTYSVSLDGQIQKLQASLDSNIKFYSGYTLTMWVKSAVETQAELSGLFNNNSDGADFQLDFGLNNEYRYRSTVNGIFGPASTEWVHLAVVCDGTDTTLYYNLEGDAAVVLDGIADVDFGQFQVGCNRAEDTFFNGFIDDVKVWNYPRTFAELASSVDDSSDYYEVSGQGACQSHPSMDLDGDCIVSLMDLSKLAQEWLLCGLVPAETCSQ